MKTNNTSIMKPLDHSHQQNRLTYALRNVWRSRIKLMYVNKNFIDYIEQSIAKLSAKDKLAALYYFKKLAIQVPRLPDDFEYDRRANEIEDHLLSIAEEQVQFEPVKWLNAEIEYLLNTHENLTSADVNNQLDVMQEAKVRLSKEWLTKLEVMGLFSISKSTLNRRIAEGMPAIKRGKSVYFYLSQINEWMKSEAA